MSLTIIGEGSERLNLERLILNYNLEEHVILTGMATPETIRAAFWMHDVYLLLSNPVGLGRRETQGLATLEAQACGLPAVVFDSGGIKYTVKDGVTGFVCDEFDVISVVNKLELLVKTNHLVDNMGKNAIFFVKNTYAQKNIEALWKELYLKFANEE